MRLFINYKRHIEPDQTLARHLERALLGEGYEVFRDETGIYSGAHWAELIQRELEKSDVVISLVSNAALQSGWVLNEIDWARKLGKLIIPILLEKLADALEFQEYIPRFMRVQHYTYDGDATQAGRDICARLRLSPAVFEAQWHSQPGHAHDTEDDSVNEHWEQFVRDNPQTIVDARLQLTLRTAVRVAILRTAYYQRNLRSEMERPEAGGEAGPRGALDAAAFAAFRQCFFTQISLGEFGVTAFTRPGASTASERGGFLELCWLRRRTESLRRMLEIMHENLHRQEARLKIGLGDMGPVAQQKQAVAATVTDLHQADAALEDAVEQFKTYELGLPPEVPVDVIDDMIAEGLAVRVAPMSLEELEAHAMAHRPDRELLAGNAALRRGMRQRLRVIVRDLERCQINHGHALEAANTAKNAFEIAEAQMQAGHTSGDNLMNLLTGWFDAQDRVYRAGLNFLRANMRLARETGHMPLDAHGVWQPEA